MKLGLSMTLVLVALAACTPKDKAEATPAASAAAAATPTPTIGAAATASTDAAVEVISATNDPLPARNNLSREARRDINAKNYKTELDKIEKDLDAP